MEDYRTRDLDVEFTSNDVGIRLIELQIHQAALIHKALQTLTWKATYGSIQIHNLHKS